MFDLCAASRPQIKTKHQQQEDKTRQEKKRKEDLCI
jgi:hypothetical protein